MAHHDKKGNNFDDVWWSAMSLLVVVTFGDNSSKIMLIEIKIRGVIPWNNYKQWTRCDTAY